jgi:hypothetical protein
MTLSALPEELPPSRFGYPKPLRLEEFKKLHALRIDATERIVFQGQTVDIPIIRVPIALPKYRMANGRTASLQSEYIALHPSLRADLFSGDPELWDAQEIQHELLLKVAQESGLRRFFEDTTNKQVNPILVDENGFVVNGNRRLSTWRDLLFKDSAKYGHFSHIDIAVLPHCDVREIDRIEAALQIAKDIRADYSWDAEANMILAKQVRDGFSNKDIAELYGMRESEVQELLDMRAYADEYLRSRNKENLWSQVSEHEFAFKKIVSSRQRVVGVGDQELFKQFAFTLIDNPGEAGRRLYDAIPAIVESLPDVKLRLLSELPIDKDPKVAGLDELFGGGPVMNNGTLEISLARAIQTPANAQLARNIIVDVIETQRQLRKDSKSASYLLDSCAKAQSSLAAAAKDGLRPESRLRGVGEQLDQIEGLIAKIRAYLSKHAKH